MKEAERARGLFAAGCAHPHRQPGVRRGGDLPPPNSPDSAFWDQKHWITLGGSPQKYLRTVMIPYKHIGTDRAQIGSLSYRPRPLNGVWATGPFLHNGSVPPLFQLLSPVAERPKVIWLGNREFEAKDVGVGWAEGKGLTQIDTSKPGKSNQGHELRDAAPGTPGVIGPLLKPDERRSIIEYLKTL